MYKKVVWFLLLCNLDNAHLNFDTSERISSFSNVTRDQPGVLKPIFYQETSL